MKKLEITETTTLWEPNVWGDVPIGMKCKSGEVVTDYVSFLELEKFVASFRKQIITNATGAVECNECLYHETRGDPYCAECGKRMSR